MIRGSRCFSGGHDEGANSSAPRLQFFAHVVLRKKIKKKVKNYCNKFNLLVYLMQQICTGIHQNLCLNVTVDGILF